MHIKHGLLVMLPAAVFFALMGAVMILLPCVYLLFRPVRKRFVVGV
ncbi:MAG: hypothetical protein GXP25_19015 [Planctomycetes bacterium]|nr:hypothetical protein [Planctomycetota bacterium]